MTPVTDARIQGAGTRAVLVVHNALSRFVKVDCDLLAKEYAVTVRCETSPRELSLTKIWREVRRHDLVFCWFASWHSFFPVLAARLQRKPSVVVVGGYDTANVPAAKYGSQRGGLRKLLARAVMRLATHLIVNSNSARTEAIANGHVPSCKITTIYHGVPNNTSTAPEARARMALTVGNVCRENLLRKGLLPFVQAARFLPDVQFVHAGAWQDDSIAELRRAAGKNVEFRGFVTDDELAELYGQASVYVQASLHEGFGMSVAESMAAGCIPVTTTNGALPEVAGDTGVFILSLEPEAIASAVASALSQRYASRLKAQRRVQEMFSLEQRASKLKSALDSLFVSRAHFVQSPSATHASDRMFS